MARQAPDSTSLEPRYRVLVDWFSPGLASDGHEKYLLFKDEFSGFGWIFLCPHNDVNSVRHFESFFTYVQNQYRVRFKALRIDKEPHISTDQLVTYLDELGVDYEEVPKATPAQGGGYERAGGVINAKARAIFIATRFPEEDLWPEVIHTATLLVNLTPRYQNGWESPWMVWHEAANRRLNTAYFVEKPNVSFMRVLGCRAYPLNEIGKAIAQHKPISAAIRRKDTRSSGLGRTLDTS